MKEGAETVHTKIQSKAEKVLHAGDVGRGECMKIYDIGNLCLFIFEVYFKQILVT